MTSVTALSRPVEMLNGLTLPGGWVVGALLVRPAMATGGKFSVGYQVSKGNEIAFLKALDFMSAFQSSDWTVRMQEMLSEYNYERDISIRLSGIRRVVTSKGAGSIDVPGFPPPTNKVSYILFELAEGDIRTAGYSDPGIKNIGKKLRSLHHVAVGISHLHTSKVTHQDLKPSNIFTFEEECKIGDFGCSSDEINGSPNDVYFVAGDPGYVPPEFDYPNELRRVRSHQDRQSLDLYHLGSLIYFLFQSGASARSDLKHSVVSLGYPLTNRWVADLPILNAAFSHSLSRLEVSLKTIAPNLATDIVALVKELCDPDPLLRGNPRRSHRNVRLNAQRYASKLDNLARRAELRLL